MKLLVLLESMKWVIIIRDAQRIDAQKDGTEKSINQFLKNLQSYLEDLKKGKKHEIAFLSFLLSWFGKFLYCITEPI